MTAQVLTLAQNVRNINTHYEQLSEQADPNYGLEGQVGQEAYYAEELYDDSTVVDVETNRDDVERAIRIATGSIRHYELPYMRGEKEVTDEFIRTKSLMLRDLNRLFMMRTILSNMGD